MRSGETPRPRTAVIFDLWGTLVPFPSIAWDSVLARTAAALGARLDEFLPAWHADYSSRAVGDVERSLRRVCQRAGVIADDARIANALEVRRAALAEMFVPRPDAAATLRRLRARRYRLGLLTNCTSEVPRLWRDSPLCPLMDAAVYSCAEGLRKPQRAVYELAASRLGVGTHDCAFVGDGADSELSGAAAAGMHAILLRTDDIHPPRLWDGPVIQRLSDVLMFLPGVHEPPPS